MTPELTAYLSLAYRRDILGESVNAGNAVAVDPDFIAQARAEIARIKAIGFGADLANRDFASYAQLRALERLVGEWEARGA